MRYIIVFLVVITFGCSPLTKLQKQQNKVARKLEKLQDKYPEAWDSVNIVTVKIDTVIKEIQLEGETQIDTVEITKVLTEYDIDTVEIPRFITRFLEATKDTVQVDSLDVHLWVAGSGVTYRLTRDSTWIKKEAQVETITITETQVIRKRFYEDWLFWIILILAITLTALVKKGKISINLPNLK